MKRREYGISIVFNRMAIAKVIIDSHFEAKHSGSINDNVILQLVNSLDGELIEPVEYNEPYAYFVRDKIEMSGRLYKLIWLIEDNEIYIGVVNAYRRK